MKLKSNRVKRILREGGTCFGTMLRILKTPQAIALCASQDWDYIILDTEHNDYNIQSLADFSLVAKYEKIGFFVRVPDKLYYQMAQMLDVGAEGLVLPQVKTKRETEEIIKSTKYSPWGKRGVSISETVTRFRNYDLLEYTKWANEEIMTIIQIESEEGVNNAKEIVSTKGVNAVMIGPADLTQDMGIPGQISHPKVEEAFREIILQCNEHGVAPGIHLSNFEDVKKWHNEGMRFITYSYDINFFKEASKEALIKLRNLEKKL